MENTKIIFPSENRKLGYAVAATYRKVVNTCPTDCSFLDNGCYAQKGYVNIWSKKSKDNNDKLSNLPLDCKLVRLNVSGDFLKFDGSKIDQEMIDEIREFALSRPKTKIWGYTHAWKLIGKNPFLGIKNIRLHASLNSFKDRKKAKRLGYSIASVKSKYDKRKLAKNAKYCPIDILKFHKKKINIGCSSCRLCIDRNENNPNEIVFIES